MSLVALVRGQGEGEMQVPLFLRAPICRILYAYECRQHQPNQDLAHNLATTSGRRESRCRFKGHYPAFECPQISVNGC
jgi:hypothetical protein